MNEVIAAAHTAACWPVCAAVLEEIEKEMFRGLRIHLLITFLILAWAWVFGYKTSLTTQHRQQKIAFLCSDATASHRVAREEIWRLFENSPLGARYELAPYCFHGFDELKVSATCESLLNDRPAAIFVVGAIATRKVVLLARKRNYVRPIVFLGVGTAVEMGLIDSEARPGANVTGVSGASIIDNVSGAQLLYLVKPSVKKVLIPFDGVNDPDGDTTTRAKAYREVLESYGVEVTLSCLDSVRADPLPFIAGLLKGHDAVLGVQPDALNEYTAGIAKLCNEYGVTFFCTSVEGKNPGSAAAVTYSVEGGLNAVYGLSMMEQILLHGASPATMPVYTVAPHRCLCLNPSVGRQQGIDLNVEKIKKELAANPSLSWLKDRIRVLNGENDAGHAALSAMEYRSLYSQRQ